MNQTPDDQDDSTPQGMARRRQRPTCHWRWQMVVAVLLALIAVEGQPVAASHAKTGPVARSAEIARRQTAAPVRGETATASVRAADVTVRDGGSQPDLQIEFTTVDEAQAGQPLSYTVQVRNGGAAARTASISAVVPPELTNVRVSAPGFVCTRHFTPNGAEAGTLVACMRNDLERGAAAEVTIEANAPGAAGTYHLTAVADPRDDVAEADESNNTAGVTLRIHG